MSQIRQKPVSIERRLKSRNNEYDLKWNQPYLSRGLNLKSLNSAFGILIKLCSREKVTRRWPNKDDVQKSSLNFHVYLDSLNYKILNLFHDMSWNN